MKCTCGPYPTIDLTSFYYHNSDDGFAGATADYAFKMDKLKKEIGEKVRDACHLYGCFHLEIKNVQGHPQRRDDKLDIFRSFKNHPNTEERIEQLFEESFLQNCINNSVSNSRNDSNKNIGGMHTIHFDDDDKHHKSKVTFRGRTAESGDPKLGRSSEEKEIDPASALAEPKQSWEFQRCQAPKISKENKFWSTQNRHGYDDEKIPNFSRLSILKKWTNALHSITVSLVNVLNLPQLIIEEAECHCQFCPSDSINEEKKINDFKEEKIHTKNTKSIRPPCNIDLLRVFRYDPLSSNAQRMQHLGSSPHTDWGAMTIVWQDSIGGLQTYCHLHNEWNNVPAPPMKKEQLDARDDATLHFFVHVGDFLSLATHSQWPSPRHRVICPSSLTTDEGKNNATPRCSLVYFAYPKVGVTLAQAERRFSCMTGSPNEHDSLVSDSRTELTLTNYSLLQNQALDESKNTYDREKKKLSSATQSYKKMQQRNFHEVISEKWNQVQRG